MKDNGFKLTKERSRRYPAHTLTDADYANDIARLANTLAQAETLIHSLERAAAGIALHVNADKTEYMCFNQRGDISTLNCCSLKLVDKFTYRRNSVSSTETDINMRLAKAWTAIDKLSVLWKSDLTEKIKRCFSKRLSYRYSCMDALHGRLLNVWKKADCNYIRMLRATLNKSWKQHLTKQQLYGHLPSLTKTIQVRRTRHAGHCWKSRDELISDILLWTPSHGRAKTGRPARTNIQQLCADIGCSLEDVLGAMDDREG